MGILQKKCRAAGKKALAYKGKGGQNTGIAFPALRLGVVLYAQHQQMGPVGELRFNDATGYLWPGGEEVADGKGRGGSSGGEGVERVATGSKDATPSRSLVALKRCDL